MHPSQRGRRNLKTQSKPFNAQGQAVGRRPPKACMEPHCSPCALKGDKRCQTILPMSLTKEFIDQETLMVQGGERGVIHLHREGSFFRAYEWSAFRSQIIGLQNPQAA